MNCDNRKRVIIAGGDHHNTLAAIRGLGRKGGNIYALFLTHDGNIKNVKCAKSRYLNNRCEAIVNDEKSLLNCLLAHKTEQKQILFPCADLPAYVFDKYSHLLSANYIVPGFNGHPGQVVDMMDKWNQWEFAESNQIRMAQTWKLDLSNNFDADDSLSEFVYPCILKPEVSAEGDKSDIVVVYDEQALKTNLTYLIEKHYKKVIVQEYLSYDMQYLACGCISHGHIVGTLFKKVREAENGSTAYGVVVKDKAISEISQRVLQQLAKMGYNGHYDIEFFGCGKEIYLNEINFRHSGAGCILINNGINTPRMWCDNDLEAFSRQTEIAENTKFISEIADVYNVVTHKISVIKWIKDALFTKTHTLFCIHDLKGTWAFYYPFLKMVLRKVRHK